MKHFRSICHGGVSFRMDPRPNIYMCKRGHRECTYSSSTAYMDCFQIRQSVSTVHIAVRKRRL